MKKCFLLFLTRENLKVQFIKTYTEKDHQKAQEDFNLLRVLESDSATVELTEIPVYSKQTISRTKQGNKSENKSPVKKTTGRQPVSVEFEN